MKPLIGITSNYSDDPNFMAKNGVGAEKQDFSYVATDYSEAVIKAGGVPVLIPMTKNKEALDEIIENIDGIIIAGGNDIDTLLYNERPLGKLGKIYPQRDELDIYLIKKAIEKNVAILGICRGIQIINVAFGGSLIQDIPSEKIYLSHDILTNERYRPAHYIKIEKGSILSTVYGKETMVNSYHHQSVKTLGDGLKAVAWSEDGICEAIELEDDDKFLLAVQWHPEMMALEDEKSIELFKLFINNTKKMESNKSENRENKFKRTNI